MSRFMLVAVAAVALCTAGAVTQIRADVKTSPAPLSKMEQLAAEGLSGQINQIRQAIADVSSGDETKARRIVEIAMAISQVRRDAEDLGLVQSGTTWVRR